MLRRVTFLLCSIAMFAAGCSHDPEHKSTAASPTAPTALAVKAATSPLATKGPDLAITTPGPTRQQQFTFRGVLENKYQVGLQRPASTTFVDKEGDAVWMNDYNRYRLSGCSHQEAIQRVLAQIDGNPPGIECGANPSGFVGFPARPDELDARRVLETKYQQMGRSLNASYLDIEGSAIWQPQFYYYMANACSAEQATQKVMDEIDGKGVQPVCYVPPDPCTFYFYGTNFNQAPGSGGNYVQEVDKSKGPSSCQWTATSNSSWLRITAGSSGGDKENISYTVDANTSNIARTGKITISFESGSAVFEVAQGERTYSMELQMFDYKESTAPTSECKIKNVSGGPTTCSFVVVPRLNDAPATISWAAVYDYYGATRNQTANGAPTTFSFQESCNAAAPAGGDTRDLTVFVTVTDTKGVVATNTFNFTLRVFPCS